MRRGGSLSEMGGGGVCVFFSLSFRRVDVMTFVVFFKTYNGFWNGLRDTYIHQP